MLSTLRNDCPLLPRSTAGAKGASGEQKRVDLRWKILDPKASMLSECIGEHGGQAGDVRE